MFANVQKHRIIVRSIEIINLLICFQNSSVHARPKAQPPIVRRHKTSRKIAFDDSRAWTSIFDDMKVILHIKCLMRIWLHIMFVTQSHARCNDDTGRNCSFSLNAYYEYLMRTNINTDGLWILGNCSTSVYSPLIFICIKNEHIQSRVANLRTRAETLRVWQNRNNIANIYL